MGTFTKGDVVLFPFPYTDLSTRKLRPCLVLSGEMGDDILLCQITAKETRKDDFIIELNTNETESGSLLIESYIRTNMIFTAAKNQILKKVCRINKKKYVHVVEMIYNLIKQ